MAEQPLLNAVIQLLRTTANYQMERFRSLPPGAGREKIAREFVSEVDLTSEQMLLAGLHKLVPEAGFYGEETGRSGTQELRWVIDPLDGTTNYLSGLEQFCISVALENSVTTELGVVLRPASNECYSAIRNHGAFHNEDRCPHVCSSLLKDALIGTGFPYRSKDLASCFFPCAEEVLYSSRGIRRFGAAALDLCYVSSGYLQGFWETDLQPYDVAAALLFLDETGCVFTNLSGERYSPYRDRILVCGSPEVHPQLLKIIAKHYPKA